MIYAFLVSLFVVAAFVWQDGVVACPDGQRYTSGKSQPKPFHRRFCGWHKRTLQITTLLSLLALGTLMGSWSRALILITLPGAWLLATRPTTVDAPAMLIAWLSAMLYPSQPYAALALSCVSGFIHERGPVYAALYAWHPMLLVGLIASGWWRTPAPPDADLRVGRGILHTIWVHRADHDWLDYRQTLLVLRGLPFLALFYGCSKAAWFTLGLSWMTRLICTDLGRLSFWAAPLIIRDMPDVAPWMALAHAVTFRRMA